MCAAKDQAMNGTWPLVCNVKAWHVFSIERVLANLDGSLIVWKKNLLQFTEINNSAQTEGKLITAFQYFWLIDLVFYSVQSYFKIIFTPVIYTFTASLSIIDSH